MINRSFILKPFKENSLQLEASVELQIIDDQVRLDFYLSGSIDKIFLNSNNGKHNRVIGLWGQTCFELFLLNKESGEYFEFNLGSDSSWNCFIFSSYRSELTEHTELDIERIKTTRDDENFSLSTSFDLSSLGHTYEDLSNIKVCPTCVLKTEDGATLYYSTRHPDSVPNFHHPESFEDLVI